MYHYVPLNGGRLGEGVQVLAGEALLCAAAPACRSRAVVVVVIIVAALI